MHWSQFIIESIQSVQDYMICSWWNKRHPYVTNWKESKGYCATNMCFLQKNKWWGIDILLGILTSFGPDQLCLASSWEVDCQEKYKMIHYENLQVRSKEMFPAKCQWCYWGQVGDARWDLWFTWAAGGGGQIFKGGLPTPTPMFYSNIQEDKGNDPFKQNHFSFTSAVKGGGQTFNGRLPTLYSNI